jgi:hypothetical protein
MSDAPPSPAKHDETTKPDEVDPKTGTDAEDKPVENPSG